MVPKVCNRPPPRAYVTLLIQHFNSCEMFYMPRYAPHLYAAAQLQPIQALRLACGAQRALLPVAVDAMNRGVYRGGSGRNLRPNWARGERITP